MKVYDGHRTPYDISNLEGTPEFVYWGYIESLVKVGRYPLKEKYHKCPSQWFYITVGEF